MEEHWNYKEIQMLLTLNSTYRLQINIFLYDLLLLHDYNYCEEIVSL